MLALLVLAQPQQAMSPKLAENLLKLNGEDMQDSPTVNKHPGRRGLVI